MATNVELKLCGEDHSGYSDDECVNNSKMNIKGTSAKTMDPTPKFPQVDVPTFLEQTFTANTAEEETHRHRHDDFQGNDYTSGEKDSSEDDEDILYGFPMREFFNLPSVPAEDSELSLSDLKKTPLTEDKNMEKIVDLIYELDLMALKPNNVYDALRGLLFSFIHCCYVEKRVRDGFIGSDIKKMNLMINALEDYASSLDWIIHSYTCEQKSGSASDIKCAEVRRTVDNMKDYVEEFPAYQSPDWLINEVSPDHIFCSVLGIEAECADWMKGMPDDIRHHQTDQYWIECYLENKAEEMEDIMADEYTGDGEPWKTYFMELGFTKYRATYLVDKFINTSKKYVEHQTPLYWAKVYIENTFTYDMLLNNVPRYPYCPDIVNTWIRYDIETGEVVAEEGNREGAERPKKILRFINHIKERHKDTRYSSRDGTKYPPESDEKHLILFHGTTHKSAKSLAEKGILLAKGRECQDFSDEERMGFYLSHDFETARLWANKRGHGHAAVVVYKIPKDLFSHFQDNHLDLNGDRKKWREIVKYCRTGKYKLSQQTSNEHSKAAYVEGPICLNPFKLGKKEEPTGFGRGDLQTCILSEDMAKSVGELSKIDGIVFL